VKVTSAIIFAEGAHTFQHHIAIFYFIHGVL
ncbi:MAG: hypothetical protein ACI90V_007740, partial [Bacillariaceae sp.]